MSLISKCPKCHQQVTVPDGLDPDAEVRCPLCVVVYPLREALAEAPPALIPVDIGAIQGPGPDSEAMLKSDLISEPFHVPEVDRAAEPATTEAETPSQEGPLLDDWQRVDVAPHIDTGSADETSSTTGAARLPVDTERLAGFEFAAPEGEHEPSEAGPPKRPPKRKKKEKGAARLIIEVLVGGILGLAIGYYVLCWVLGPEHGLPELPLPLLPHTMHWFAGAEQTDKEADDDAGNRQAEQPSAKEPGTPKRQPEPPPESQQPSPNENEVAKPDAPPARSPVEQPEPKPAPLPADYVGPRAPPSFTSDELGKALKAAHDALSAEGTAGKITPEAYQKLCRMGHVLTFVEGDARDGRLADRRQAIRTILKRLGDQPGGTDQIGRLAGALLENKQPSQGGVLLAGTAGRVATQGRLRGAMVRLAAHGGSVSVLSDRPLPFAAGDQVIILGSIVSNPAEELVGYSGSKPLVVWTGTAIRLAR